MALVTKNRGGAEAGPAGAPEVSEPEMFGPKRSLSRDAIEKRPPLLRMALIAGLVLVASSVSAVALVGTGSPVADDEDETVAGVPAGVELTPSGNVRVTRDGTTIDALDVSGWIYVKADDVTVTNTRVRTGGSNAIQVARGFTGLVVEDSTLECTTGRGRAGVAFGNYEAHRVAVGEGCRRGFITNRNTTITESTWGGEAYPDVAGGGAPVTTVPPTTEAPTTTVPPTTEAPTTTAPPTTAAPAPTTPTTAAPAPPGGGGGGFPTAATTGVPAGVALRGSGGMTITEPGRVVDGLDIRGQVIVDAPNVTIRNSRITSGGMGIRIASGNLLIEDSEVIGTGEGCSDAIGYAHYEARRIEVSGCLDGLKANGDTTIVDSFIHDLRKTSDSHNDGIQVMSGRDITIEGNTICGVRDSSVSAIKMTPERGAISGVSIRDNFLYGGNYSIYMDSKPDGYGQVTDAVVSGNTMDVASAQYGSITRDAHPTQQITGNITNLVASAVFGGSNPCE